MYGPLCLQKDINSNIKNVPLRLTTAKGNIGKWASRLSEMMKKPQLIISQKTRDPKVSLVSPKFDLDKLYSQNDINGDARPMARDGDQIAFYVEREIGPILVGGGKSKSIYRQRVIVVQNYVTGQTVTLSENFPGSVEKVFFAGNCLVVWSEPASARRIVVHRWQTTSCVTIWSRKTGAFLRVLISPLEPSFLQSELSVPISTQSHLINITCSVMNVVTTKGSKNIWLSLSVIPFTRVFTFGGSKRENHHDKSGKISIRNG